MLERYFVRPKTADRIRSLWLGPAIEKYVAWLAERRAAKATVLRCVQTLVRFTQFAGSRGATTWTDLPSQVGPFVDYWMQEHGSGCCNEKSRSTIRLQARTPVEQLLRLLIPGFVGSTRRRLVPPFDDAAPGFLHYLEHERGFRPATRERYVHHLGVFETYLRRVDVHDLKKLSPELLTKFLTESAVRIKPGGVQQRSGVLRTFVRYLHRQDLIPTDLSRGIPRGRQYRHAAVPRSITWAEVRRVLEAVDRRTPVGKRDYALLLLLVTYGLRAREVAALQLDDIDWQREQIHVIARKGGHSTVYPLSTTVGEALVEYLQQARPAVSDRHVFLATMAPFAPLRPHVISGRAAHHLQAAGVDVPRPGSHTFRHTCVQRLVDADFPFKVIGDYVGHRTQEATQVYGKVAIHHLRQLALGDGEEAL